MRLFKTPEEREAAKQRGAEEAFAASAEGQAIAAFERGDPIFQVVLEVDQDSGQTIHEIEQIGWRLDHVGYAYEVSSYSTRDYDRGTLDGLTINSALRGVYLFRRG